MTISENDLRGLSAVEREALLASDADDEDVRAELGSTNDDEGEELRTAPRPKLEAAEVEPDDEGEADLAPATKPALPAAEAPAGDEPQAASPEDEAEDDITSGGPQQSAPADAADQRKTLRAEKSAAMQQLLEGEITQDVYQEVEDRVQDKLDALVRAEASDQARTQMRQDAMWSDYETELRASHKELRSAGLDLKADEGKITAEFDRAIRMFAAEAGARGLSDQPGNLAASRDALAEARAYILRRHGKSVAAAAPAPAPTPASPARSVAPPDRSKLPPTLATVPVAADASISNEFAHLESLEGANLERAVARLTPDQQERYLT